MTELARSQGYLDEEEAEAPLKPSGFTRGVIAALRFWHRFVFCGFGFLLVVDNLIFHNY